MKTIKVKLLVAAVLSVSCYANAGMKMKSYHQEVMTNSEGEIECALCHVDEQRKLQPTTSACESCHGSYEEVAELTMRPDHSAKYEPNPHNSVHYEFDLSCSSCHKEHKESVIYCNNCHELDYPEFKK